MKLQHTWNTWLSILLLIPPLVLTPVAGQDRRARGDSPLAITGLPSSADWVGESDQQDAQLGYAVSTAGDVNGDGYSDLIVGAPWYDGGETDEGAVFVYYGSASGLGSTPAWSVEGDQPEAHLGTAVSAAGDVDGDGYADVAIGAPGHDGDRTDEGAVLVYKGGSDGLQIGPADWTKTGDQDGAHFGAAVSTAGDVDGDGYADLIVGAPDYDGDDDDAGAAFVYLGGSTGLTTGAADWTETGDQEDARFGAAVSTAGDLNSDGYDDVVVGTPNHDGDHDDAGAAFVYLGGSNGLTTNTADWMETGDQEDAHFGAAVSTAGDVNGDGYADLIVGAPDYDGDQTGAGAVSVYLGSSTGLTAGAAGWMESGDQEDAHFGAAVSIAGDLNSDGYADVVVGTPDYDDAQPDAGAAFVYYGSARGLTNGAAGWTVSGNQENAHLGAAVATAGDVNGDGHSDLVVGATGYAAGQTDEGGAFVHHGSPGGLSTAPAWIETSGDAGVVLGWSVATAGDVNGDGYDDVIVGVPRYDNDQPEEGIAFLYAGGPDGPSANPAWTVRSNQAYAWFGTTVGSAGDVNGDGYDDVIVGASRYDAEARDEGAAFVYQGGPTGVVTTTAWLAHPTDQPDARFGIAVSTAGDVNGDGFSDVLITANGYDAEEPNEGAAFVYHGGPTGLASEPAWAVHPTDQAYANFGRSAATAGDVNRDGYSDVVVGAPWYDTDGTDEGRDRGAAFLYLGSAGGLSAEADWATTGESRETKLGIAISTAGDVNRDGYSDVIVGAYQYTQILHVTPWREGAAFTWYGGPAGLADSTADWVATSGQKEAKFGLAVSTAGDVNGDGYADVVVGAPNYADGQPQEGATFVYWGGPTELDADPNWSVEGNQKGAGYGFSVSAAGDVNGDGYGDLIVGAPTYNSTELDEGAAYVYLGNGGGGVPLCPRQVRADGTAPIAPLGSSDSANQVRLAVNARSPLGRAPVAFEWQVAPLGAAFTATGAISGTSPTWSDVLTTGVVLSQTVDGLTGGTVYHWRVRLRYRPGDPTGQPGGRWLYLGRNGPQEADFRTPSLLSLDRNAQALPGQDGIYRPLAWRWLPGRRRR